MLDHVIKLHVNLLNLEHTVRSTYHGTCSGQLEKKNVIVLVLVHVLCILVCPSHINAVLCFSSSIFLSLKTLLDF